MIGRRRGQRPGRGTRWSSTGGLRRDVRAILRELQVEAPLDVRLLCDLLSDHRGRYIELRAAPLPAGIAGLWTPYPDEDLILYQQHTTPAHQDHTILHEIGHLISGHQGVSGETLRRAVEGEPHAPPYDDPVEQEAEMVATVIKEWVTLLEHLGMVVALDEPRSARIVRGAFDDHQAWL